MNDEERAFPITIDPTIGVPHSYTTDLDIASGAPSANFENSFSLNVSSTWRSYWKIPSEYLPTLPSTAHIWKAELKLFGGGVDPYVGVYEITSDWDETLTWNKMVASQGTFGSNLLDYKKLKGGEEWYSFDLTEAAKKWYNGQNNYGVGFKLVDGTDTTKSASFYSYEYYDDYDDRFVEPCFYVYYSDISGLEDYYSLSSHSVAGIGRGSVNLASGNLTIISDLVSSTDYLMPMTVSAVYNSDMAGKDYNIANSFSAYTMSYMPYGFKLNIAETIIEKTMWNEEGNSKKYCILSDADGTNHYFYYDYFLGYVDDSAQGRTLSKLTNGNIEITYRDQSKKTFTKMSSNPSGTIGGWVLSEITDSYGNSVKITLDSSSYRPTKISLLPNGNTTAIDMITFTYSGGKLYQIESPNSQDYVTFNYSSTYNSTALGSAGKYLRKITYGNRNSTSPYAIAQIEYNSSGKIINIQNSISLSKTVYTWNGNKVSYISEYGNDVLGQRVAYSYGKGYTDIRSTGNDESLGTTDDIVNRYIYDIYGRTVSAYSGSVGFNEIYGATMGSYETATNAKNSIKESTIVYDNQATYLENNIDDYFATLPGGITKTEDTGCYKQIVFEESNPSSITYNADMQYIISGFGYSNSIIQNDNAKFSLSAKVYYYQGAGVDDEVVTHHFDFADVENTWQFVSGKLDCLKDNEASISYDVVRKIELICNYYGQIDVNGNASVAQFKDVAFTDYSATNTNKYSYNSSGRLSNKSNGDYYESYEYDDQNRVAKVENSYGEYVEYIYEELSDGGRIEYENRKRENSIGQDFLLYANVYVYNKYGLMTDYIQLDTEISDYSESAISQLEKMNTVYVYQTTSGSKIFGALMMETDPVGNKTIYAYNASNGRLLNCYDNTSLTGYTYSYDNIGRLTGVCPFPNGADSENVRYSYDSAGYLTSIATDSTTYTVLYDDFGNSTGIKAGSNSLATYEYYPNNGKIKKINYGNGFSEDYVYNTLEMLSEIWYTIDGTRILAHSYTYNSDGTLHEITDHRAGKNTKYEYDNRGRLEAIMEKDVSASSYNGTYRVFYDSENRVSSQRNIISYSSTTSGISRMFTTSYGYDDRGQLTTETLGYLSSNHKINYTFDNFGRTTSVISDLGSFDYTKQYNYVSEGYDTSYLVGSYTSTVGSFVTTYSYEYDSKGNITSVAQGSNTRSYTYDDLGQLISETAGRITKNYAYDNAGNITSIQTVEVNSSGGQILYAINLPVMPPISTTTTVNLTYSNSEWGDLLTSYNGTTITYDAIGNPLSYYNGSAYTFIWEGRRLVGATTSTKEMSFAYNDEGIRTSKTVNDVEHIYYLNGSQIVAEEWSDKLLVYLYDASGSPIGMMFRKTSYAIDQWDVFWFSKNLQGDIESVYNESGEQVAYYSYHDAWGNHTAYTTNSATEGARYNPFRYRGYYYDADLEMYYLQSRYYDPNTCRFINADGALYHSMLGCNIFVYCENNPIIRVDNNGDMWQLIPALDPRNMVYGGGGDSGLFDFHPGYSYYAPYDSFAYNTYCIRTGTAIADAQLLGYYSFGPSSAMLNPSAYIVSGAVTVTDNMATSGVTGGGKGFSTFRELKKFLGSAGANNDWHHIVEQSQIEKSGFSPQQIHNTNNIVPVNRSIHSKISGYYSSKQEFTGKLIVREWLAGQSYKAQYEFGIKIFNEYTR